MSSTRNFNRAHAALKGIESKSGFLSDETLLHFVESPLFAREIGSKQTERQRSFRDFFRALDRRISRQKGVNEQRKRALLDDWFSQLQSYFGYSKDFRANSVPHWDGEGTVPFLESAVGNHSVAVFFSAENDAPTGVDLSGFHLSDSKGNVTYKSAKVQTLAEQVERALKGSGCSEAVLFLPFSAYYFRSESQTSGQYLEVRWFDILMEDNDSALALATHLLHADFFEYRTELSSDDGAESLNAEDSESEDADEAIGSGDVTRLTASSSLFKEDLEQARKITEELHKQVTLALELLINERLEIDPVLKRKATRSEGSEKISHHVFKDGLFVLYRILFVLYAEARDFLPSSNAQYASFYSLEHLRDWAENFIKLEKRGEADSEGTYIWGALQSIFTLLRRGVSLEGGQGVSAFNGQLFAPEQAPYFDAGPELRDGALARVLLTLSRVGGDESARRLHFGNLGVEQLGAVYEALLAQKPIIIKEESVWVSAHPRGVGLISRRLADALEMAVCQYDDHTGLRGPRSRSGKKRDADKVSAYIDSNRPAFRPDIGKFVIAPLGGQKRQTASFYTPPKLAEFLVRRTLKPLVDGKTAKDILQIKVIEPAVGSGGFLIATLRFLAAELLRAKISEGDLLLRGRQATFGDLQECKRQILENCIFGVDINPLSLELCRTGLYLEALVANRPLPFLHHRLRTGNSLINSDLMNRHSVNWGGGQEFPAIFDIPLENMKIENKVLEAWDVYQDVFGKSSSSDLLKTKHEVAIKRLKDERSKIGEEVWAAWATGSQPVISKFIQYAARSIQEFERIQDVGNVVDAMDDRYKDHLAWIPDMDDVLVEAADVEVDEHLVKQRREALVREHGLTAYAIMVRHQRAFMRLKALGDVWCSFWFLALDANLDCITYGVYKELVDWLLDERTLDRKTIPRKLSPRAFQLLKSGVSAARKHRFFHWDVEFAQIFGGKQKGFSAVISNPPWKVVGVKDKDIFPSFDPQYLKTKSSAKAQRLAKLYKNAPEAAQVWLERSQLTAQLSALWRSGQGGLIKSEGQGDLATFFVLLGEKIVGNDGRLGMLVSRNTVFVNNGTKFLREHFFSNWGLEEAVSFRNTLSIFEIATFLEFSALVGQPKRAGNPNPKFIHGVVDINLLDSVSHSLDARTHLVSVGSPRPVNLSLQTIGKYFSKETLSIPGLTDSRQLEFAKAFHEGSGPITYLPEINVFTMKGVDRTFGPKKGVSAFTEDIPKKEIPTLADVRNGKFGKWTPLYSCGDFHIFEPFYGEMKNNGEASFSQYGKTSRLSELGIDVSSPSLFWRKITSPTNQRYLVCSIIPQGIWAEGNVWCLQSSKMEELRKLELILGSIGMDFLTRFSVSASMNYVNIASLPLANYSTGAMKCALELRKKKVSDGIRAQIDALMLIHYDVNQKVINEDSLTWMLETQFPLITRNNPEYLKDVLKAFQAYSRRSDLKQVDAKPVFTANSEVQRDAAVQSA